MRRLTAPFLIALALTLSACAGHKPAPPPSGPPPTGFNHIEAVTVRNAGGELLPAAATLIADDGTSYASRIAPNGQLFFDVLKETHSDWGGWAHVDADGYIHQDIRVFIHRTDGALVRSCEECDVYQEVQIVLEPIPTGPPPLPRVPTRAELATAQHTFQGLYITCAEYGPVPVPVFDVMADVLSPECLQQLFSAKRLAGDKVIAIAVSHAYLEPSIPAPISTGHDWTYDLPGLNRFIESLIREGFYVQLHLAGDGSASSKMADGSWRYNDPVGWTYGQPWLMETFPQIAAAIDSVHPYVRFVLGFDGVFYGWEPEQVVAFGRLFRSVWPNDVLGIEHDSGHIPLGEGGSDYQPGGRMRDYDIVFGEYPDDLKGNDVYQILGRMVRPYRRPADQVDDPNPPFYLGQPSPRGPFYYNCWEWALYYFVRNRTTPAAIEIGRQQLRTLGCAITG